MLSRNRRLEIILVAELVMTVTVGGNGTVVLRLTYLFYEFPYKHFVLYSRFKMDKL